MSLLMSAALAGVVGAVLALDRTAVLQSMASRPLVACALTGALLGDLELALRCGLVLELLWLMELPVGASVPPDDTLAGVLAACFAAATPPLWSVEARSALGVLAAVPFGVLGRHLDLAVRRQNARLLHRARLDSGKTSLGYLHLRGALHFAAAGAVVAGAGALVGGAAVARCAALLPEGATAGLELTGAILPFVGLAAALTVLRGTRHAWAFGAGIVGGLGLESLAGFLSGGKVSWRS